MPPQRALLMLSGGIDSAYCLYDALRGGRDVHAHHVHLINRQGRAGPEGEAVVNILRWLDAQNLPGSYTLTNSVFDYGDVRYLSKDAAVWSFMAGIVLADRQRYGDIHSIIVPRHLGAFAHERNPAAAAALSDRYIKTFIRALTQREVVIELPIGRMTKDQVVAAMPTGLLRLCWWCRQPANARRRCRRCITCKAVDPALRRHHPELVVA